VPTPFDMTTTTAPAPATPESGRVDDYVVVVHEPTTTGLPPMRTYLSETWCRRPFIWHLARSQLKGESYETFMGQVWLVLNPLLLAAVYLLVRSVLRPPGGDDVANIMANLVMSVFFFRFVSGGVTTGAKSIVSNRGMILNTPFPRVIFPMVVVIKQVMEFLPAVVILAGVWVVLDQPFGWGLIWIPYMLVCMSVMMFGMAMLAAPAPVFIPDTGSLIPYLSRIWLFATPVLYKVSEIPDGLLPYLQWNPLYVSFKALEDIGEGRLPEANDLLATLGWAAGFFIIGAYYFLTRERKLAARL
jgi:teichoic acid transport system permease protein